jgi:hypothetical protein
VLLGLATRSVEYGLRRDWQKAPVMFTQTAALGPVCRPPRAE